LGFFIFLILASGVPADDVVDRAAFPGKLVFKGLPPPYFGTNVEQRVPSLVRAWPSPDALTSSVCA